LVEVNKKKKPRAAEEENSRSQKVMMLAFGTHQTTKKREKLVSPSDPRE
jgi:hypothetical protein